MSATHVRDISAATFQRDVVERSMTSPVLLDFWAAWCGPCRTLGPVLERLAEDYGGSFELGKVDTEREQDLAYAFGVQGIPFCVLVHEGRPVDAFQGALPEREVVAFLERNGIRPAAGDAAEEAKPPEPVDHDSPAARLELARRAAARGDVDVARERLAGIPEEDERYEAGQRIAAGLDWLEKDMPAAAGPAAQHLASARALFVAEDVVAAMEEILASVAADRTYQGGLARKAMLLCFAVVGEQDERLDEFRRRLATLLY